MKTVMKDCIIYGNYGDVSQYAKNIGIKFVNIYSPNINYCDEYYASEPYSVEDKLKLSKYVLGADTVTYISNNPDIATVSKKGVVIFKNTGKVTITVTATNKIGTSKDKLKFVVTD